MPSSWPTVTFWPFETVIAPKCPYIETNEYPQVDATVTHLPQLFSPVLTVPLWMATIGVPSTPISIASMPECDHAPFGPCETRDIPASPASGQASLGQFIGAAPITTVAEVEERILPCPAVSAATVKVFTTVESSKS